MNSHDAASMILRRFVPSLHQKRHDAISFLLIDRPSVPARGAAGDARRVRPAIITYATCVGVEGG